MKLLHVRSLRNITMAAGICLFGFLLAYLSGGMLAEKAEESQPVGSQTVLEQEAAESDDSETATEEENAESETEAETETEESTEPVKTSAANYYIRLNSGLSSDETKLVLTPPSQLKASVEYRGQTCTKLFTDAADIEELLALLQNAVRLADDTEVVSTSSSRAVTLTLPYAEGFGNLYVFEGYPNNAKKAVTLIQDNANNLYQAKSTVVDQLFDLVKPVETSLEAERLNIYTTRNYEKSILKAQSKNKDDYALILSILNSLEKCGSSLDLDSPDYLITLLPSNSVQEDDYCYLWLDEKYVKIAFADDDITVYRSTEVTSSQMKKWIKSNGVK